MPPQADLFPYAKAAKDRIENIIGRHGPCDLSEGIEGCADINHAKLPAFLPCMLHSPKRLIDGITALVYEPELSRSRNEVAGFKVLLSTKMTLKRIPYGSDQFFNTLSRKRRKSEFPSKLRPGFHIEQVDLVVNVQLNAFLVTLINTGIGRAVEVDDQVGVAHCLGRLLKRLILNIVLALLLPRDVEQLNQERADLTGNTNDIPRGPRLIRGDRTLLSKELVQQSGLASVRFPL